MKPSFIVFVVIDLLIGLVALGSCLLLAYAPPAAAFGTQVIYNLAAASGVIFGLGTFFLLMFSPIINDW